MPDHDLERESLRILVIDDDPLVLRTLARFLVRGGHVVTACSGIRDGLAALRSAPLDMVLTDVYMPDSDGLDVLKQVRAENPSIPVIVMSGRFGADPFGVALMEIMRRLGAAGVLTKPVDAQGVLEAVAEAWRGSVKA